MTEGIHLNLDCELAILTIDRPSARNALDARSIADFGAAVAEVEADDNITTMVLTGAGGTFCAGADLCEMADTNAAYGSWAGESGPLAKRCAKPVIAAVEGYAVAGGLGLALWADLRVVSEAAVFGVFCRRFGIPMSDGTPTRLPAVVGRARALDMLLTGRPIAADEAQRIGLADRVAPSGMALDVAKALGQEISAFPPLAMAADRAAAWAAFDNDETTRLIEEEKGTQIARAHEAASGAARFKAGTKRRYREPN